jgi:hypothetical protein
LFSGSRRDLTIGKPEARRNKTGGAEQPPAPAAEELPIRAAAFIEDKCAAAAARFGRLFSSVKILPKPAEVASR